MARLEPRLNGIPIGKLGGVIVKSRNGKQYVSAAPANVKQNPSVINSQKKFSFLSPLTKALTSDYLIGALWDASDTAGLTARHKIMKINMHLLDEEKDIGKLKIVPGLNLFKAELSGTERINNEVHFTIAPLNLPVSSFVYRVISARGFIYYFNPAAEFAKPFVFLPAASDSRHFSNSLPFDFILKLTNDHLSILNDYESCMFCMSLIIENLNREPCICSETISIELRK